MNKLSVTGTGENDLQTMSSYELKFPLIVVLQSRETTLPMWLKSQGDFSGNFVWTDSIGE